MSKQAEGGRARAEKLTGVERSAIARKGAKARWSTQINRDDLPRETHQGELHIGDRIIECSVLDNGMRVLSERAVLRAMGTSSRGGRYTPKSGDVESTSSQPGARLPRFLESKSIKPHLTSDLILALENPIPFLSKRSGGPALGYEATLLPKVCSSILDARDAETLKSHQLSLATSADMLIRAFAQVGIIALIDEATGYQADRERDELQKLLKVYLSEEALKWIKTFPEEFFSQIYRLKGWNRPLSLNKHTSSMGYMINELVYGRLPEGVMEELRKKNPRDYETGFRKHKHHQFLTQEVGHPHLRAHLQKVIGLLQASLSWNEFKRLFGRVFYPNAGTDQPLGLDD